LLPLVDRISSVSSEIVSGGTFRTHSGLRATINAWLEDISFRTGMIAGAVVLLVIVAAGAAVAVLSNGSQAASALGSRATATPAAVGAPLTGGAAQPSAVPSSAVPARSAAATPAPARSAAPARGASSTAPETGSGPTRSAAVAAASGAGREGYGLASPAGWRHGFPEGWDRRGWVWGPYHDGPHFGGRWW
jgi:hypothetical protein